VKTWTVEAARAYLPRLGQLLEVIEAALVPGPEPGTMTFRAGSEHAEAALAELHAEDIVLRQLPHGLVDFVWKGPDGEVRLLCWQRGESELAWWHHPDDGFAGRRPIADITWPESAPS
jgi:hypothetical protein